jgi:hypothetical protein
MATESVFIGTGQALPFAVQTLVSREKIGDVQVESYPCTRLAAEACESKRLLLVASGAFFQVGLGCCILYVVRNECCWTELFSRCPS